MGDFSGILPVLHHKHVQILNIVNDEFVKSAREHVLGAFVTAIADTWHAVASLEASSYTTINTLWLSP